ncbi:MAG: GDP-mannose 4,6-dehydratase [Vicinamibacterales bacterium]
MSGHVLVTGAAGFVGRHLLQELIREEADVVGWYRPGAVRGPYAATGVRWLGVDLLDRAAVRSAIGDSPPAQIYHLAGYSNVAQSWTHTREVFESNVLATHHLFDALKDAHLRPRVLVSLSAAVYRPASRPLVEDDVLEPLNPYATSKLAQEMVAAAAFAEDGIPTLLARAFNHTGPGQPPGFIAPDIARQLALIEFGHMEPALSLGNLDAARDLSDVRDVARAYVAMMKRASPGVPYNVCSGTAVSVKALVDTLIAAAKVPVRVIQDPAKFRPVDVPLIQGDHGRLSADTAWQPEISLDRTLTDVLDYWRATVGRE